MVVVIVVVAVAVVVVYMQKVLVKLKRILWKIGLGPRSKEEMGKFRSIHRGSILRPSSLTVIQCICDDNKAIIDLNRTVSFSLIS